MRNDHDHNNDGNPQISQIAQIPNSNGSRRFTQIDADNNKNSNAGLPRCSLTLLACFTVDIVVFVAVVIAAGDFRYGLAHNSRCIHEIYLRLGGLGRVVSLVSGSSSDVVEPSSEVAEPSSDVVEPSSEVAESSSEVAESSGEVAESPSEVSEPSSEVSRSSSDASESLGEDTRSPYLAEYTMAEAGKTAHYRLRWVSTSGETSAWSEIESATIAG